MTGKREGVMWGRGGESWRTKRGGRERVNVRKRDDEHIRHWKVREGQRYQDDTQVGRAVQKWEDYKDSGIKGYRRALQSGRPSHIMGEDGRDWI